MSYQNNGKENKYHDQSFINVRKTPFITKNDSSSKNLGKNYANSLKTNRKVTFEPDNSFGSVFEFKNSLTSSDLTSASYQNQQYVNSFNFNQSPQNNFSQTKNFKASNNQAKNNDPFMNIINTKNLNHQGAPLTYQTYPYQRQINKKPDERIVNKQKYKNNYDLDDCNDDVDDSLLVILTGVNLLPIDNKNPKLMKESLKRLFKFIDNFVI